MKKNNFIKAIGILSLITFLGSCSKDPIAPIVDANAPTMTISLPTNNATVPEGSSVTFVLTLARPLGKDFDFFVVYDKSSTASADDSSITDPYASLQFQKKFVVPAFSTTFTGTIDISKDVLAEGTEKLVLQIGDTRTSAVIFTPAILTTNITNVVKDQLDLKFNFNKTFGTATYSNTLCNVTSGLTPVGQPSHVYDVDFIVYDNATGNPVSYPGATGAQTAACTEALTMKLADYPNGTYDITAYLYGNADLDLAYLGFPVLGLQQFDIPITVDYSRSGVINGTYTQEGSNYFNSNTPVDTENYVCSVVIAGVGATRTFTIQNSVGVVTASGKKHKK